MKFIDIVAVLGALAWLPQIISWIYNWMKNGWKTAGKEPVKNKELWQELYALTQKHKVEFIKVKGHADNEFNNRCDEMAREAISKL